MYKYMCVYIYIIPTQLYNFKFMHKCDKNIDAFISV